MYANLEDVVMRAAQPTIAGLATMEEEAPEKLKPILAQIGQSFYQPGYTVEKLKRQVKCSNWLFTQFRLAFDLTPWTLIQECRMEMAARLLLDTSIPVEEVALLVGYEDFCSFHRLCLDWCALTPAVFRRCLRKVKPLLRELPEDVLSWRFSESCRRGTVPQDRVDQVIRCVRQTNGLNPT